MDIGGESVVVDGGKKKNEVSNFMYPNEPEVRHKLNSMQKEKSTEGLEQKIVTVFQTLHYMDTLRLS